MIEARGNMRWEITWVVTFKGMGPIVLNEGQLRRDVAIRTAVIQAHQQHPRTKIFELENVVHSQSPLGPVLFGEDGRRRK